MSTVKGYINGNLEGTLSWNTGTNGNLNRNNYRHHIGRRRDANNWFVGYIADFHWIDGQAKIPTDFAEEYNGVWTIKAYSGTYGNNGFRLDFADNTGIGRQQMISVQILMIGQVVVLMVMML